MTSPISVLSPLSSSRQNARSPLVDSFPESSKPSANSPRGSLEKRFSIYNENASPLKQDMHTASPTLDAEEEGLCDEWPPSSPFQEMVSGDLTGLTRDMAPRKDGSGSPKGENPGEDDVNMDREDFKPDEPPVPTMEHAPIMADITFTDEQKDVVHFPDIDSSIIHYRSEPVQVRKVSGMTVNHENMSIVYHPDEEKESPVENGMGGHVHLGYDTGDDTCLSTFSAVPNADMTLFAKLRADSPLKRARENTLSPKKVVSPSKLGDSILRTPNSAKRDYRRNGWGDQGGDYGSPTPGRKYPRIDDTPNLLEFTDQLNGSSHRQYALETSYASPARRNPRLSPLKTTERFRSPSKLSLLDFDIPPVPTPRSIPSITPRELESLKSSFLSQISSLKATLSGRDAEVASLKEAVADAERRVGEALEEVRNEAARKEALESEQREWERRGKEMESVLRGVKAEIVDGERERKRLADRVEEAEKSKEHLEGKIVELQSQLSAVRQTSSEQTTTTTLSNSQNKTTDEVAKEVQDAVEKVARELHTLYKGKHETKVAALKKSYEARWEKRVREAEKRFREAMEENEKLKLDNAMSTAHSSISPGDATMLREHENLEAEKRVLEAKVKGLEQEILSIKQDNEILNEQLKNERAEKGELVAVVDEFFAMQQQQQQQQQHQQQQPMEKEESPPPPPPHRERTLSVLRTEVGQEEEESLPMTLPTLELTAKPTAPSNENAPPASNIARFSNAPSGIRPRPSLGPTPKVPRFGMPAGHVRSNSKDDKGPTGIPSKTPLAPRSGIMSSIERMGRGGM
ncbi:uncharacterized protein CIMG_04424 [Coccidioides immitis RS]|uniref:Uncharacterized protein n=1 Tax=Coccidioides immitis (strain RS) TaxID=246410 RepID=A0A0E1RX29_COCIM|nr:uncharacterized protein CIMG_04424 [Coccidioides immitis RS]EAS33400.2 hypothetical protein CIMG_04424 [Coccidioides immitis RS]